MIICMCIIYTCVLISSTVASSSMSLQMHLYANKQVQIGTSNGKLIYIYMISSTVASSYIRKQTHVHAHVHLCTHISICMCHICTWFPQSSSRQVFAYTLICMHITLFLTIYMYICTYVYIYYDMYVHSMCLYVRVFYSCMSVCSTPPPKDVYV